VNSICFGYAVGSFQEKSVTVADFGQLLTVIFAAVAAFVSFQGLRLAGRRRVAEYRFEWLNKLRSMIAELFAELAQSQHRPLNLEKVTLLMESIDLFLDVDKPLHRDLKNALMPLALSAENGNRQVMQIAFHNAGKASRTLVADEGKKIEGELRGWFS
jgi:hypothetical protein